MPKIALKKPKRFKHSSKTWLTRQLNDPYVQEAQRQGYRSRAAFKLMHIQEKFNLLKMGYRVVDLGCAPGSWSQVCRDLVLPPFYPLGYIVGVDLSPMEPIEGVTFIQGDFCADDIQKKILEHLQKQPVDVVLSDMAPATTGERRTDHLRIMMLAEESLIFASRVLKPGGAFVVKTRQGGATQDLLKTIKSYFHKTSHFKPDSSRSESSEMFTIAQGFR